jgi:hypothetical protein
MIVILGFPPRYDYVVYASHPTPRIAAFPAFASQTLTHNLCSHFRSHFLHKTHHGLSRDCFKQ